MGNFKQYIRKLEGKKDDTLSKKDDAWGREYTGYDSLARELLREYESVGDLMERYEQFYRTERPTGYLSTTSWRSASEMGVYYRNVNSYVAASEQVIRDQTGGRQERVRTTSAHEPPYLGTRYNRERIERLQRLAEAYGAASSDSRSR